MTERFILKGKVWTQGEKHPENFYSPESEGVFTREDLLAEGATQVDLPTDIEGLHDWMASVMAHIDLT